MRNRRLTSTDTSKPDESIGAANGRLIQKALAILASFVLAYVMCKVAPEAVRSIASHLEHWLPSIRSLREAGSGIHETAYPLFGLLAVLMPVLAVYVAWDAKVLTRFRFGSAQSGRSRVESLIAIYVLYLPVLVGLIFYLSVVELDVKKTSNTAGSLLVNYMLTTDIGLFTVGLTFYFALVMALAMGAMALWMPIAYLLRKAN